MCLTTTKKSTLVVQFPKPDVATQNIVVYKALDKSSRGYKSPYQGTLYLIGKTYKVPSLGFRGNPVSGDPATIDKGFHSCTTREKAMGHGQKVFTAIIPKGAKYLYGINGDVVSTAIKITSGGRGRPIGSKDSYKRKTKKKTARKKRK